MRPQNYRYFTYKFKLNSRRIDNWSLHFDLVIILRTFAELTRASNAY
jgi:lipopolysaccharide/colanic/teichoic acid biosynthesis glycosyltransferase